VVLKSFMAESLGRPIEALGIPVLYVDFESPEQYRRDLLVFGDLLQDRPRAEEIWRRIEDGLRGVTARIAGVSEDRRPRVLFLYDAARGREHVFNVPPAGWIQTRLVEMAGGRPVWKQAGTGRGWNRVGFEQIAAWDPDWVFVVSYHQDVDSLARSLRDDPAWRSLAAVRAGRLAAFPVDYYSWDQPDLRWVLGLRWLATRLHPDRFAGADLDREVIDFFSFLYGMSDQDVRRVVLANLRGGYR
jgi:iron complex transport system substrate-binding protein